jgi:SAM-dependent methyltransferase
MDNTKGKAPIVSVLEHYEALIDEDNDPMRGPRIQLEYMARWDGHVFFDALGPVTGKRVLEVGVGTGRVAKSVLEQRPAHFTGIDISAKTIARAEENLAVYPCIELLVEDVLTFRRTAAYDAAYSVLTFIHIENKRTALTNMVDSLVPGGRIVLSVSDEGEWLDFGSRRLRMYPALPENFVVTLRALDCKVEAPMPVVDNFIRRNGQKSETYGQTIAWVIRAVRRGRPQADVQENPSYHVQG